MRLLTTTLLFPDNPIFQVYLFAEHRRHQILPGLVRDGDIGFQGIVVFVTGEGHHDLGRHSLFKGMDAKTKSILNKQIKGELNTLRAEFKKGLLEGMPKMDNLKIVKLESKKLVLKNEDNQEIPFYAE